MTKNFHSLYFCIKQCEFVVDDIQFHVKTKHIQEVAEVASIRLNLGHEKRETNFCHSTICHLLSVTYFRHTKKFNKLRPFLSVNCNCVQ